MTLSKQHYLVGVLLLFVWSIIQPSMISAQNPTQARINTLKREIRELKDKVNYWKPKFDPRHRPWIFVPLTKGYWPVKGEVKSPHDVMRETGRNHWVKNTKGNYAIDTDRDAYRDQFRQRYAAKGQEWVDRQWRELMDDNDRVKRELLKRLREAEKAIADKEAELNRLTVTPPPAAQPVTEAEKETLRNELKGLVAKNKWHADEHVQVEGQINKAQTRHKLDVAKQYMNDCDACRVDFNNKTKLVDDAVKAGTMDPQTGRIKRDEAIRSLWACRDNALQKLRAHW